MNFTPNLKLPIFEPNDHPDFLTDFNDAFKRIDEVIGETKEILKQHKTKIEQLETRVSELESVIRLTERS